MVLTDSVLPAGTTERDKGVSMLPLKSPRTPELIERARAVIQERKRRTDFLSKAMFGEPAWEILLQLYVSSGSRITIGEIVNLIGEPKTTTLRWIDYLEEKRLISKGSDPFDGRLTYVHLVERGRGVLDAYFGNSPA